MEILRIIKIRIDVFVDLFPTAAAGLVCKMVRDDVDNNLDAILILCNCTQLSQFRFGAEPCIAVRNCKSQRLIQLPPLIAVRPFRIIVLRLLHRRGLYRNVPRRLDIRQRRFDLVIRPVEAVQDRAALNNRLVNSFRNRRVRHKCRGQQTEHHDECQQQCQQFPFHTHILL